MDIALGYSLVGLDADRSRSTVTRLEYLDHRLNTRGQFAIRPSQIGGPGGRRHGQRAAADAAAGRRRVPVGNESGQVGKYLMEHPEFQVGGEIAIDLELDRYWPAANKGRGVHAIVADDETARSRGCTGAACSARGRRPTIRWRGSCRRGRAAVLLLQHHAARRDAAVAGQPRLPHRRARRRGLLSAGGALRAGRARLPERRADAARARRRASPTRERDACASTTTASTSRSGAAGIRWARREWGRAASTSVVDADCRVHGYDNLFVAGSSVFPERRRLREPDADHRRAGAAPGRQARRRGDKDMAPGKAVADGRGWRWPAAPVAAGSAAVVWKSGRPGAARGSAATGAPASYVDHEGWMLTPADKQRLEHDAVRPAVQSP